MLAAFFESIPILSLLIVLPLLASVFILYVGSDAGAPYARSIALSVTIINCLLSIPLYYYFDPQTYHMQFVENHAWVPLYSIRYALGIDGLSLLMVILTNFTGLFVVIASYQHVKIRIAQYLAVFLILQAMLIGVFCALDAILFYVFWEGMLIPMYLSIGVWGSSNRSYAAIKFFLFTFLGSILMLLAFIFLYKMTGAKSFMIHDFYHLTRKLPLNIQEWLFFAFLLAFAVKIPMWPVHTWLPDAHTEAPAGGSVVLAALMLKLGIYGLLRFSMPITPLACFAFAQSMIVLSLIAIVYIGLIAIIQSDMKKLVAYSSIAHMGFATLGCFMIYKMVLPAGAVNAQLISVEGAIVQMISHAVSSSALFLGIGMLSQRLQNHSRLMSDYGGVANTMPMFAAFFMLFAMSNVGLPGTAGFVGEFMVIMSAIQTHFWVAGIAAMTLVLSASYTLWMYKRVFFGEVANQYVAVFQDINGTEIMNYILLSIGILGIGLYPAPIIHILNTTVQHLLSQSLPMMMLASHTG